jgi:hypothetical protein
VKESIKAEYTALRSQYINMIGTLYPSIVYNELCRLRHLYQEHGGDLSDLAFVLRPNPNGSVPYHSGVVDSLSSPSV